MILEHVVESDARGVYMGATKSSLYALRRVQHAAYDRAWARWDAMLALLTPAAKKRFASFIPDVPERLAKWPGDGTDTKNALERQTTKGVRLLADVHARENKIFIHWSMNPHVMDDGEKDDYLPEAAKMMNSEAVAGPGSELEPEWIVSPTGHRVRNPRYTAPPEGEGATNAMEYLPFVGIGIGLFRLFFS